MPAGPENPIFSSISQEPTIGNISTHENRLTRCQYIHWSCYLASKMWLYGRIHHPEETHIFVAASWHWTTVQPHIFPQYLNNQLQETLLHVRMDQLDANSSIGIIFWQLECRIHPQLLIFPYPTTRSYIGWHICYRHKPPIIPGD